MGYPGLSVLLLEPVRGKRAIMDKNQQPSEKKKAGLLSVIIAATLSRSVINTSRRFIYPFAPVIARGLGVPLTAVTSSIAVNQATSLIGLFTSHLGDQGGYKRMMTTGLILLIVGMAAAGSLPFYYTLILAMFLSGLGKTLFDPAITAYAGSRVDYKRRGLVIGIMEVSWAAATLVGIPVSGVLIHRFGWRSPFFALAGAGMICLVIVFITVKNDSVLQKQAKKPKKFLPSIKGLLTNKRALGASGFGFFVSFANDNLFVTYGAWLEDVFQLSVVALGLGTIVIGIAELLGELFTATLSDRLGLTRSVAAGALLCSMACLFIPGSTGSLTGALACLFAVFLSFEFSMVSIISLCTELVPESRATMMSLFFAFAGLGRVAGAFTGGFIWQELGMGAICILSAFLNVIAVFCLILGIKGWSGTR